MVVDHEFRCTLTEANSVEVPSEGYVKHFLSKVKALDDEIIKGAGGKLKVWKLRRPRESCDIQQEGYLENLRRLENHKEGEKLEREEQEEDEEEEEGGDGDEEEEEEENRKKEKPKSKGKGKAKPKEKEDVAWPLTTDNKISVHLKELSPSEPRVRVLLQLLAGGTSCCTVSTGCISNNQRWQCRQIG